jgi:hypothetical protein
MVRVSAVAVAAAIANFFIRVTPVFLESLLGCLVSRVTGDVANAVPTLRQTINTYKSTS